MAQPVELVISVDHVMDRSLADIRGFEHSSGVVGAPVEPDSSSRRVIEVDEDLDV